MVVADCTDLLMVLRANQGQDAMFNMHIHQAKLVHDCCCSTSATKDLHIISFVKFIEESSQKKIIEERC